MLNKMGYKEGKGLGKAENAIKEPIKITEKLIHKHNNNEKSKLMYILSDSMLSNIDPNRLSNKYLEVNKFSHGGCRIQCMYNHLPIIFMEKPDFIVLHIATNDCVNTTSDEVIKVLGKLKVFMQKALPSCRIYISLPTMRTDNQKANTIRRNLKTKLRKINHFIMDNANISELHIAKKGLHLNSYGVKKIVTISFASFGICSNQKLEKHSI